MPIKNDILEGALQTYKVKTHGSLKPTYIVLHYTMGGSLSSSVDHLNKYGYGYNIMIDRDGTVYQTAAFNRVVAHAGMSNWRGWDSLNDFSVGVSFANYGPAEPKNGKYYVYGKELPMERVHVADHYNGQPEYEAYGWETFPKAQIDAGLSVCKGIVSHYPIRDIIRHDDVAIGRKVDTGPALDLEPFVQLLRDRASELIFKHRVKVSSGGQLSIRKWADSNAKLVDSLPDGEVLYVRSFVYFYKDGKPYKSRWCSVSRDGFNHFGYVNSSHLEEVMLMADLDPSVDTV